MSLSWLQSSASAQVSANGSGDGRDGTVARLPPPLFHCVLSPPQGCRSSSPEEWGDRLGARATQQVS